MESIKPMSDAETDRTGAGGSQKATGRGRGHSAYTTENSMTHAPKWHLEILKARMGAPATWLDWDEVKASLWQLAVNGDHGIEEGFRRVQCSSEPIMIKNADNAVLADMARAIVDAVQPMQVVVFGSHARGDATAESDVDLLVVEAEPFGPGRSRRDQLSRIRRALSRFRVPKDVLVYSRAEVDHWKTSPNHVIRRAFHEGRVLYGHE